MAFQAVDKDLISRGAKPIMLRLCSPAALILALYSLAAQG
jgi:hypothetical protein